MRRAKAAKNAKSNRELAPAALIALYGLVLLGGCTQARTKDSGVNAGPKPEFKQKLAAYGLPKDFFERDADTKCGHQIIGYRFLVWLGNDAIAVGFSTSPKLPPFS